MNSNTSPNVDFPELVAETLEIWEQNARWWDAKMGEGNTWHRSPGLAGHRATLSQLSQVPTRSKVAATGPFLRSPG